MQRRPGPCAALLLFALLGLPAVHAAPPPAVAQAEIEALLARLVERGQVASAEHFIARAASRSSTSGESYRVKCGNRPPLESAAWLQAELQALRGARDE